MYACSFSAEKVLTSYNLASKINGLLHVGLGDLFYDGLRGGDIARSWGIAELDTTTWGAPLLTRGCLLDIVGLEAERGGRVFRAANEKLVLEDNYRVTLEDLLEELVGEIVDAGINDDDARAAAMSDTRMKYGGVKRH